MDRAEFRDIDLDQDGSRGAFSSLDAARVAAIMRRARAPSPSLSEEHEPDCAQHGKGKKYDPEADCRCAFASPLDGIVEVRWFDHHRPRRASFRTATIPAATSGTRAAAALILGECEALRILFRIWRGTPIFANDLSTFGISISASLIRQGHEDDGLAPRRKYVDAAWAAA